MKNDNKNNKKYIDADEGIKIVRRTLSPEVENGIVIAAYTYKNGSLINCACLAKGEAKIVFSLLMVGAIKMLDDYGFNLDSYIKALQRFSDKRKNK